MWLQLLRVPSHFLRNNNETLSDLLLRVEGIDSASIGVDSSRIYGERQSLLHNCGHCLQDFVGSLFGILLLAVSPKGMNWEDGLIVSIGGFLILTQIEFGPVVKLYETRDKLITQTVSRAVKNE